MRNDSRWGLLEGGSLEVCWKLVVITESTKASMTQKPHLCSAKRARSLLLGQEQIEISRRLPSAAVEERFVGKRYGWQIHGIAIARCCPSRNESRGHKNLTAWYSMTCGRPRSCSWRCSWQYQDGHPVSQSTLIRAPVENKMEVCTRNCANDVTDETVRLMPTIARLMNRQSSH